LSNIEKYCPIIADTTDIVAPYNDKAQPPFKYIQTFFSNHLQIIYLVRAINSFCPQLLLLYPQKKDVRKLGDVSKIHSLYAIFIFQIFIKMRSKILTNYTQTI